MCAVRCGGASIRSRLERPYSDFEKATSIYFHGLPLMSKSMMVDLLDIGAKMFLCGLSETITPIRRPDIETEGLFRELLGQFPSYPRMIGYVSLIEEGTDEAAFAGIDEERAGLRKSRPPRNS